MTTKPVDVHAICVALAHQAELERTESRAGVPDTDESPMSAERKYRQALARCAQSEYNEGEQPSPSALILKLRSTKQAAALLQSCGWHQVPHIHDLATLDLQFDYVELPNTWYAFIMQPDTDHTFAYWQFTFPQPEYASWLKPRASN